MRIAHLSDLHISTFLKKGNIGKTKKLLKYAVETGFDHLVITGDLSDNSEAKDFVILRKILENFNLLDSRKTTIIIGNHDIFGGVQTAIDVVNFPSKCLKTDFHQKVNDFVSNFKELFDECYFPIKDSYFPYAKVIGDVVLVGLNTIDYYSRLKNPFASNGKVGKKQRNGLKEILTNERFNGKRKFIMSHHHFYKNTEQASSSSSVWNRIESYTLKLKGKKKLLKLFSDNNVELVLHGHSHEMRDYIRKGIRFLNAGGAVDNSLLKSASVIFIDINENIEAAIHSLDLGSKVKPETIYSEISEPVLVIN